MNNISVTTTNHRTLQLLLHSLLVLTLFGCTDVGVPERQPPDGEPTSDVAQVRSSILKDDEAAAARIEKVRSVRQALSAIDKQYPPPQEPIAGATELRVKRVLPDATIELENEKSITMEGVACITEATESLEKMLLGHGATIVFIVAPDYSKQPTPAQFWVLERFGSDGENNPAYSVPAETALINGWCRPDCVSDWPNCPRYKALSRLASP